MLKLAPLSRKALIWHRTAVLCDVGVAGTLYTSRQGNEKEGRAFSTTAIRCTCASKWEVALCVKHVRHTESDIVSS